MYILPYRLITVLGLASSEHELNVSRVKLTREKLHTFRPKAAHPSPDLESSQTVHDNTQPGQLLTVDRISVAEESKISMV